MFDLKKKTANKIVPNIFFWFTNTYIPKTECKEIVLQYTFCEGSGNHCKICQFNYKASTFLSVRYLTYQHEIPVVLHPIIFVSDPNLICVSEIKKKICWGWTKKYIFWLMRQLPRALYATLVDPVLPSLSSFTSPLSFRWLSCTRIPVLVLGY